MPKKKSGINKGGFSWKRATGITGAKQSFSRKLGIPLTKSGRQRKFGKAASGGCVVIPIVLGLMLLSLVPLSCSQNEKSCEWQDEPIALISPNSEDVFHVYYGKSEPFSVRGETIRLMYSYELYPPDIKASTFDGYFSIDVYNYPDLKFIKAAVNDKWTGYEASKDGVAEVPVKKGMYCLYVSTGAYLGWAIDVFECS